MHLEAKFKCKYFPSEDIIKVERLNYKHHQILNRQKYNRFLIIIITVTEETHGRKAVNPYSWLRKHLSRESNTNVSKEI
jgi:hypothetical protein